MSRALRTVVHLLGAGVVGLAVWRVVELTSIVRASDRPPLWDEAKYGWSGLRIAEALRAGAPWEALVAVNDLSVWPPLVPLLEAAAFLLAGPSVATARGLSAGLYGAAIVLTFLAVRELTVQPHRSPPRRSSPPDVAASDVAASDVAASDVAATVAGALAACWAASAPLLQAFGTLAMLEVPGVAFLALAAWLHARALRLEDADPRRAGAAWRLAWIAATLLFFCKLNYGLLWLAAAAIEELRWGATSDRAVFSAVRRRLGGLTTAPRPWTILVVLVALAAAAIQATGGFELEVAGRSVRATSAGNLLYGLYLLAVLRWATVRRDEARVALRAWRRAPPRRRHALTWTVLPIGLWMLLPPHLKELVSFVDNRSSDLGMVDGLAVYARALAVDYTPQGAAATVIVSALMASGLISLRWIRLEPSSDPRRRLLAVALVFHGAGLLVHPYKLPRFAATPAWVLAAAAATVLGLGLGVGLDRLLERLRDRDRVTPAAAGSVSRVAGLAGLAGLAALLVTVPVLDRDDIERRHALRTAPPSTAWLLEQLATVPRSDDRPLIVLGTGNGLSPHLLAWDAAERRLAAPRVARELVGRRDGEALARRVGELVGVVEPGTERSGGATIAVVDVAPRTHAADPPERTAWEAPARGLLEASLRPSIDRTVDGVRLRIYEGAQRLPRGGVTPSESRSTVPRPSASSAESNPRWRSSSNAAS